MKKIIAIATLALFSTVVFAEGDVPEKKEKKATHAKKKAKTEKAPKAVKAPAAEPTPAK